MSNLNFGGGSYTIHCPWPANLIGPDDATHTTLVQDSQFNALAEVKKWVDFPGSPFNTRPLAEKVEAVKNSHIVRTKWDNIKGRPVTESITGKALLVLLIETFYTVNPFPEP